MNYAKAVAVLSIAIGAASLLTKPAAAEVSSGLEARQGSIVVAQRSDDRFNDRREELRREELRREQARQEELRREELRRNADRRVWIPGHYEPGFLGIGRKWVEGHWEDRR